MPFVLSSRNRIRKKTYFYSEMFCYHSIIFFLTYPTQQSVQQQKPSEIFIKTTNRDTNNTLN